VESRINADFTDLRVKLFNLEEDFYKLTAKEFNDNGFSAEDARSRRLLRRKSRNTRRRRTRRCSPSMNNTLEALASRLSLGS
jgi:hypothetical protein